MSSPLPGHDIESAAIYTGGKDGVESERLQNGEHMARAQQRSLDQNFDLATLQATINSMTAAMEKMQVENKALLDLVRDLTLAKATNDIKPEKMPIQKERVPLLEAYARRDRELRPERSVLTDDDDEDEDEDLNEELKEIHIKDVGKPSKYRGEISKWRHWFMKMKSFLERRDGRWGKLLDSIKADSKDPLDEKTEKEIFQTIKVLKRSLRSRFKEQMYEYLEEFTEGIPHANVITGTPDNVMEVFRQLCDEGFSTRDRHLRK